MANFGKENLKGRKKRVNAGEQTYEFGFKIFATYDGLLYSQINNSQQLHVHFIIKHLQ